MNLCSALLTTINEAAMKQTGKFLPGFDVKDDKNGKPRIVNKPPRMSVSKRIAASKSKRVKVSKRVKGSFNRP